MDKKDIFGDLHSKQFKVGDIVEWSSWNNDNQEWDYNYGMISEIKNELRSDRLVSISKVLPVNNATSEIEHFTMSLRLVSKINDKEEPGCQ